MTEYEMALIVPYRDRAENLKEFIPRIKNYLENISFHFFIIEQCSGKPFNKGRLYNAGFTFAKNKCKYVCFHDVDMIPISADYSYPTTPTHLATHVEQFFYDMPFPTYFGGVTLFNILDFEKINGFSNEFWYWGYEDDEVRNRCEVKGLTIASRSGLFLSLPHEKASYNSIVEKNKMRLFSTIAGKISIEEDGLNTLKYKVLSENHDEFISHYTIEI